MGFWEWISHNWFDLFSAAGIGGLWLTVVSLRAETKARRNANLLTITANHREVWKEFLNNPKLVRVCDASANTAKQPVTDAEQVFVTMVILHINSVHYAIHDQLVIKYDGLRRDIAQFLSLPIPSEVWNKIKNVQNDDFIAFVESCRNWKQNF